MYARGRSRARPDTLFICSALLFITRSRREGHQLAHQLINWRARPYLHRKNKQKETRSGSYIWAKQGACVSNTSTYSTSELHPQHTAQSSGTVAILFNKTDRMMIEHHRKGNYPYLSRNSGKKHFSNGKPFARSLSHTTASSDDQDCRRLLHST